MKYITDEKVNKGLQDLRDLRWSLYRHSSGTAGSFLKAFSESKEGKKYYKLSNYDAYKGVTGHECINEIIADRVLKVLEIDHLEYKLVHSRIIVDDKEIETWLCESMDYKKPGEQKMALDAFYQAERQSGESPLQFCKRNGWGQYCREMLLIDYLILNRDRHGANIEVLKNAKDKTVRIAPLFDHGLSLLFSCNMKDNKTVSVFDVLDDKHVQSFIGGNSAQANIDLLPRIRFKKKADDLRKSRDYVFYMLEDITSETWRNKVWEMIIARLDRYENIQN